MERGNSASTRKIRAALLCLVYLVVGSAGMAAEGLPERSVKLNNYNNSTFGSDATSSRSAIIKTLALRDNVCFTEGWGVTPKEIKALNPGAKVYLIYDLCCKNTWDSDWNDKSNTKQLQTPLSKATIDRNDWWLRDRSGKIVKENDETWFLDVGKPGFAEAFLRSALSRLEGQGYDGVVLDYWWPDVSWLIKRQRLVAPAKYSTDDDWFYDAWYPFVDHVVRGLRGAGYRIIGNCVGEYGTTNRKHIWQRSKVDGVIYEQWAVSFPKDGRGVWLDGKLAESQIRAMSRDPLEAWAADFGLQESDPQFQQKRLVSLAMYYIAIPSSQGNRSYNYCRNRKVFWDELWNFNIGTPTETAAKRPNEFFWSREFTRGLVLLNYEASKAVAYSLKRKYRDPSGHAVSGSITIPPHTGMILAVDE